MADRYWVGGDGTWNTTDTSHWSSSSGGSAGASVPTLADNVILNNASSGATALVITISGNVSCSDITITRDYGSQFSGSSSNSVNCYGSTVSLGSLFSSSGFTGWFNVVSNCSISGQIVFKYIKAQSGSWASISQTGTSVISEIQLGNGSTVVAGSNLYISKLTGINTVSSATLSTGAYNVTITGGTDCINGAVSVTGNGLYIEPSTGACSLRFGTETASLTSSISKITLKPLSAGATFTFAGYCTFSDVARYSSSPSFRLKIQPTSTAIKCSSFSISGDVSTTIYIEGSVSGTRSVLEKIGGGTVSTSYVDVKDMQPHPDDTWISYTSTNSGNNYRWYFDDFDKPTSNLFFGSHL